MQSDSWVFDVDKFFRKRHSLRGDARIEMIELRISGVTHLEIHAR